MPTSITECQFCGRSHGLRCPEVKSIEYFADGGIKRVEFMTPADYMPPLPVAPMYTPPIQWPTSTTWGKS